MKVNIVYWSGTGNTQQMADYIREGAESSGAEVKQNNVEAVNAKQALDCDILALGCPSMGDEVLEESEFEPFITALEGSVSNKKVALFGSYDWGDGQWMRDWAERMKEAGAQLVTEPLIVNLTPEGDNIDECKAFGRAITK